MTFDGDPPFETKSALVFEPFTFADAERVIREMPTAAEILTAIHVCEEEWHRLNDLATKAAGRTKPYGALYLGEPPLTTPLFLERALKPGQFRAVYADGHNELHDTVQGTITDHEWR